MIPRSRLGISSFLGASASDNIIEAMYGGDDDPIAVNIRYQLNSIDFFRSQILETVQITNSSFDPLDLSWFEYTDLDIDGSFPDQFSNLISTTQIRQIGENTTIDVQWMGGLLPDRWEIASYPDLLDELEDDDIDNLSNANLAAPFDDDYTSAFQWDIEDLPSGALVEYTKQKIIVSGGLPHTTPGDPLLPIEIDVFFTFPDLEVFRGPFYFFDPDIAIGYDYSVTGVNFESVLLPDETSLFAGADNAYELWVGGSLVASLTGGVPFDFTTLDPAGLDSFTILGIDEGAALDPTDPLAFVTGLSFVGAGTASVTQTPITNTHPSLPAPSTLWLFGAGLLGLGMLRRRFAESL